MKIEVSNLKKFTLEFEDLDKIFLVWKSSDDAIPIAYVAKYEHGKIYLENIKYEPIKNSFDAFRCVEVKI